MVKLFLNKKMEVLFLSLFFLLLCVPLPFLTTLQWSLMGFSVKIYYPIYLFLLGLWFLFLRREKIQLNRKDLFFWIFLLSALGVSVAFSFNPAKSIWAFISLIFRGFILAFLFQLYFPEKKIDWLITGMCVIAGLAALNGIVEFIMGMNIPYHRFYSEHNAYYQYAHSIRGGIVGSMGHPLVFSVVLALFAPIVLFIPVKLFYRVTLFFLLLSGLLLTESRSGLVCLAASLSFVVFIHSRYWRPSPYRTWAFILIVIPIVTGVLLLAVRLGGHYSSSILGETHRMAALHSAVHVANRYPFFGTGLGCYPLLYHTFRVPLMDLTIASPDNQYLRWWMETGAVGLVLMALFLYKLVGLVRRYDFSMNPLALSLLASLLGGCIGLTFFDGFDWFPFQFTFWSLLGILLVKIRKVEGRSV